MSYGKICIPCFAQIYWSPRFLIVFFSGMENFLGATSIPRVLLPCPVKVWYHFPWKLFYILVRTPSIVRKRQWKQVILTMYYDRTLLLFSRPMRDKDTSALRDMFQYSSLVKKSLNQWEIATHWRPFKIQDKSRHGLVKINLLWIQLVVSLPKIIKTAP